MFKENDLYQFEDFITSNMQSLTDMKRKKHNSTVGFVHWKLTKIYNVILYHTFLRSDTATVILAGKLGEGGSQVMD